MSGWRVNIYREIRIECAGIEPIKIAFINRISIDRDHAARYQLLILTKCREHLREQLHDRQ